MAGSYPSTADPDPACRYLGGSNEANAAATVSRATPNRRAIARPDMPSDRLKRLISGQLSTLRCRVPGGPLFNRQPPAQLPRVIDTTTL